MELTQCGVTIPPVTGYPVLLSTTTVSYLACYYKNAFLQKFNYHGNGIQCMRPDIYVSAATMGGGRDSGGARSVRLPMAGKRKKLQASVP
jgi:hypothetical protein